MSRSLRYDVIGVILGLALPLVATLVAAWSRSGNLSLAALGATQSREPLLWLVYGASLVLVVFGWAIERQRRTLAAQQARIARLEAQRRASLERTASELSATAVTLLRNVSAMAAASTQLTASLRGTIETMMSLSQGATSMALAADTVAGRALDAASQPDPTTDELAARLRGSAEGAREISRIAQEQMNAVERALASMNDIHFATETSGMSTQEIAGEARALARRARSLRGVIAGPDALTAAPAPAHAPTPTPKASPLSPASAPGPAAPVAPTLTPEPEAALTPEPMPILPTPSALATENSDTPGEDGSATTAAAA